MFKDCMIVYRNVNLEGIVCSDVLDLGEYEKYRQQLLDEGYRYLENDRLAYGSEALEYFEHGDKEMVVLAKCITSEKGLYQQASVKNS